MTRIITALLFTLLCACSSPPNTPSPEGQAKPLRVLAYNIKHGLGMDGKLDLERAADLIRRLDPDVVTLQEIDNGCERSGAIDQATWLGEACGMHAAFGGFMSYQGGNYGMALLSREPLLEVENLRLPDGSEPRSALAARMLTPQGEVIVVGIHLYRTEAERLAQAETVIERFRGESLPVLLAGDFNSQPGGAVLTRLEQDWMLLPKTGPPMTFPADLPDREIDFCLIRPGDRVQAHTLRVIDEALVSDHRPILLELYLR